ncbi:MAG: Naphthalene 1,2-dioxygenase/salicylate 5-hydroxylase systems, ferredoxin component [Syntrophomonadaceae bacterium]|nr:Naphthalene 1,2-dioxygenase/salicylate 5-hydroxylase systems, ferredoxin component [Bacillota bacterium]
MVGWGYVLRSEQLTEGKAATVRINGQSIVLARVGGQIFALHNECPHLGCPLHRGRLDGFLLQCPCHDWQFDLRTGEFTIAPEIKIPVFPVREENGKILLRTGGELT